MSSPPATAAELARDLRAYRSLCEEALALVAREHQALSGAAEYAPAELCRQRKDLLPRLESGLTVLRGWRQRCQQFAPAQRPFCAEVKASFQALQRLLMRILLLDRENQQALLRRGLGPARPRPPAAPPPGFVARLYRRYAAV